MLANVLQIWLATKNKGSKVAGAVGGSGVLVALLAFHGDIKTDIANAEETAKTYADQKHALVEKDIKHIKEAQNRIEASQRRTEERIYRLTK